MQQTCLVCREVAPLLLLLLCRWFASKAPADLQQDLHGQEGSLLLLKLFEQLLFGILYTVGSLSGRAGMRIAACSNSACMHALL